MMGSLNSLYKYAKGEPSNKKEKDLNIIGDEREDPSLSQ
jgi:hypothetical protein